MQVGIVPSIMTKKEIWRLPFLVRFETETGDVVDDVGSIGVRKLVEYFDGGGHDV
jgi:hypothetical protein